MAAWRGQTDLVSALLAGGADLEAHDPEGHTALTRAAWKGHVEIVRKLLAAGAKPDTRGPDGRTRARLRGRGGPRAGGVASCWLRARIRGWLAPTARRR